MGVTLINISSMILKIKKGLGKLIKEKISDELLDVIFEELRKEEVKIEENWEGKIVNFNELEELLICDIYRDYYQKPQIMIEELINENVPFIEELKVDIFPYLGDLEIIHCNVAGANYDIEVRLHICFFEVDGWNKLNKEQKEQVGVLREELEELYRELDLDMRLYLMDLPENSKDELGNSYPSEYKEIV